MSRAAVELLFAKARSPPIGVSRYMESRCHEVLFTVHGVQVSWGLLKSGVSVFRCFMLFI